MIQSLRLRVVASLIATLGACVLATPAAQAAEHWQRVADPAPGGTPDDGSFRIPDTAATVSGNTAYLVAITPVGQLEVYRARTGDARWRLIGKLHQSGSEAVGFPTIAVSGNTVWVAWYELDNSDSLAYLHVAMSSGGGFREVGRGGNNPLGGAGVFLATRPSIATFRGDVYIASASGVARVSKNGRRVEQVSAGAGLASGDRAWLVESGNRLYLVHGSGSSTIVSRLNRRGSAWETVATTDVGLPSDAAAGGGTLYVVVDNGAGVVMRLTPAGTLEPLSDPGWRVEQVTVVRGTIYVGGRETPAPEAPAELKIFAFENGAWRQVADPVAPDLDVEQFDLIDGGANLWLHWVSTPRGPFSAPITVHVARLLR
ncbi:MAG: hypothetical protein QOE38_1701 [Thermoleophilaceae bacterium]|nr:hypothetical protein [Thermoleophilaceae bacterium]